MSGFSFPNEQSDSSTRLAYTVAAEFIYRLDDFLEEAHCKRFNYWAIPFEVVTVVKECATIGASMLRQVLNARSNRVSVNWAHFSEAHFAPSVVQSHTVDIVTGAMNAVTAIKDGMTDVGEAPDLSPLKARMMTSFASSFFYMLEELCGDAYELDNGTVESEDVQMIRGYIDAVMGMLSDLNHADWPEGQSAPSSLEESFAEHLESHRLECAGSNAVYAASFVHDAVRYG